MKKVLTTAALGLAAVATTAALALPTGGATAAVAGASTSRSHGADDGVDHDRVDDHGGDRPGAVDDDSTGTHQHRHRGGRHHRDDDRRAEDRRGGHHRGDHHRGSDD